jgi:hypothetical protein
MNDMPRGKVVALRDFCAACFAAAECSAFGKQCASRRAVNSAVYAAPAEQRAVRRVYDRVERELGNVSLYDFYSVHDFSPFMRVSRHARPRPSQTRLYQERAK